MAQVVVVDVAVLVPGLAFASGGVEVAVPVRIEDVPLSEEAGQGPGYRGMPEDLPDLRDARQDVVSRVPLLFQHRVELPAYALVKGGGVVGVNGQVSVGDEPLHLLVGEEAGLAGRGFPSGLFFSVAGVGHGGLVFGYGAVALQFPWLVEGGYQESAAVRTAAARCRPREAGSPARKISVRTTAGTRCVPGRCGRFARRLSART